MRADRVAVRLAAAVQSGDAVEAVRQARRWCVALNVAPADLAAVLALADQTETPATNPHRRAIPRRIR